MASKSSRGAAAVLVTLATATDILAYSVAVPVLPDLSRRYGASPTVIGMLFASFGVTLLAASIPMGALSDRVGRRVPMVAGLVALAGATLLFAFSDGLPWLFAARLVQGAADAVTWVVGFALIADLYGPEQRGRVTGFVMSGTSFAFIIGPSIGGWLYEIGGIRLPFLAVAGIGALVAVGFLWLDLPNVHAARERVPVSVVVRVPAIASCAAAVVAISATISMFEPVMPLFLWTKLGLGPGKIGTVFGVAAVFSMMLHPIYGRVSDRVGGLRLMLLGFVLTACMLPLVSRAWSYPSAIVLYVFQAAAVSLAITPSLAYMAEATSSAGIRSFGVAYGLYNMAWGVGLLCGPALGGFLFERLGFPRLALGWSPSLLAVAALLAYVTRPKN